MPRGYGTPDDQASGGQIRAAPRTSPRVVGSVDGVPNHQHWAVVNVRACSSQLQRQRDRRGRPTNLQRATIELTSRRGSSRHALEQLDRGRFIERRHRNTAPRPPERQTLVASTCTPDSAPPGSPLRPAAPRTSSQLSSTPGPPILATTAARQDDRPGSRARANLEPPSHRVGMMPPTRQVDAVGELVEQTCATCAADGSCHTAGAGHSRPDHAVSDDQAVGSTERPRKRVAPLRQRTARPYTAGR